MTTVEWCDWKKIANDAFTPLVNNEDRYLLLWGGRGSSKSVFAADKLIFRCISEDYFRCILIRNVYEDIKDSSYQTIKDRVSDLGLEDLFKFTINPLKITCVNGNSFIARGCDKTTKLKSIKDPTAVWYEEDIPSESDFITITTSIRSTKAKYLQEIFTINPEVEGNYEDHWFFKRFFSSRYPHQLSFRDAVQLPIGDKTVELAYTSHHSTYKDNRWLGDGFKAFLEDLREKNPYYYTIYCSGHWGNRVMGGQFYKQFSRAKHVKPVKYNPDIPLHISFDFNVNPHMTCIVYQIYNKTIYQIDEICLKDPYNKTKATCEEFIKRFRGHQSGLFVYGDPSGKKEDTKTEKGENEFYLISQVLRDYKPTLRLLSKQPSVKMRGDFINDIFLSSYGGISLSIADHCTYTINDLSYLKEASDGTKFKEKYKDPDTKVTCEKYGHCFIGETLITTISGQKRIDEIKVGELVLTRSGYKSVLNVFDNGTRLVNAYMIGANKITCTPTHHFWTEENGFKEVGHLTGMNTFCIFEKGKIWKTTQLAQEFVEGNYEQVYDIEVEGEHEYFANNILVHNCSDSMDYMLCYAFSKEYEEFQRGYAKKVSPTIGYRDDNQSHRY